MHKNSQRNLDFVMYACQQKTTSTILSAQVSRHPVLLHRTALTAVRGSKGRVLITHTCSACLLCHGRVIDTAVS